MPALLLRLLLQCAGDIELQPGSVATSTPTNCLRLLQWNANWIIGRITELQIFLHSKNVNIANVQETKLTNKSTPLNTPRWAAERLDRHNNNGGGLLMLIKDSIPLADNTTALPQSADPQLEQQGISITMPNRQQLHIHNICIPPLSNCSAGHNASIAHLLSLNEISLIVGDINAHHSRWETNTNEDERGVQLVDEIDSAEYTILKENKPTWLPTNGRSTLLDISLASNDIALLSHWSFSTSLASDHLPILITINSEVTTIDGPRRIYINFKKADWARYVEASDKYLAEAGETRTVEQVEMTFRKAVNKASGLFIPASHMQHFQPTLPASAKSLADERDRNLAEKMLNDLKKLIKKLVVEDKRTKWQFAVDKCDHRTGISHLWWLDKCLSGKQPHNTPINGVRFADNTYVDPKRIANKFAHQFAPPPIRLTGNMSKRQLKRQFHQLPLTGTPSFTSADTKEATRLAKSSTAIGPDGVSTLHLKKLAHGALNYHTNIFNLSISTGQIPEIWHKSIIIPILEPGKDNNIGKNWRPISLLCPAVKTLEKLLLPKIQTHIPSHPAQYGFRPKHSTCTSQSTITADIAAGFSRKKPALRTVLVALDLTAAFDNGDHQQLQEILFNTNIPVTIRRWLYNYM